MRLVFLGTSDFACPTLRSLTTGGHEVAAVVTPPPRPSGRGKRLVPSPVETAADELGLPVARPPDPNSPDFIAELERLRPELGVLVAYGFILVPALLAVPRLGFINLHPSLLPRYRGAAPVQRALMDGAESTGVSVLRMTPEVDAGDILGQRSTAVAADETAGELSARLAADGAALVLEVVGRLEAGPVAGLPQDSTLATPARKVRDAERRIDWSAPAPAVHNRVRALSPVPAAWTTYAGDRLLVYRTRIAPAGSDEPAGTIQSGTRRLLVVTGNRGLLELTEVKPQGRKVQSGESFRNGRRPGPGARLE